ncbi:MAG: hypothetical protein PHG48_02515 [Eubacteriales bacterium]|nr:hypothetical protein [Eubacteriales bacterium]
MISGKYIIAAINTFVDVDAFFGVSKYFSDFCSNITGIIYKVDSEIINGEGNDACYECKDVCYNEKRKTKWSK